MEKKTKARGIALLPIVVFLVIFLGAGFVSGDFYSMPAIVGFLIALFVAFIQDKEHDFNEKIHIVAQGVGDDNIITMCLIFLAAGGFSGAVTAAGGVESTVNLGLSVLPSSVAVAGLFVIGCFISVSMGTSMGTIAALAPIAVGISEKTGFGMPICIILSDSAAYRLRNVVILSSVLSFTASTVTSTSLSRLSKSSVVVSEMS